MVIMKFGGTSVGNGPHITKVAGIIAREHSRQPVVVVSAMSQVTNCLVKIASLISHDAKSKKLDDEIAHLYQLHHSAAKALQLDETDESALVVLLDAKLAKLAEILESTAALGELTPRANDLIISYGERLSIHLVAAALQKKGINATALEASDLIVTDNNFGDAQPIFPDSRKKMKHRLEGFVKQGTVPVITGFMGATAEGVVTTFGRGGSDYSATIIGYCLDADEVWIWTDVDGVMTADPRIVSGAHTIRELSYDEAAELSCFGAKVLHPRTMVPAALGNIPIYINNTLRPEVAGTKISSASHIHPDGAKALTVLNHISLITVQGKGMHGTYTVIAKVFNALAEQKVGVVFVSQASSENNISLATKSADAHRTVQALKAAFKSELKTKNVETVREDADVAVIAVVGEGMRSHKGIAGRIFSALGRADINIMAIAQGSSERNISFIILDKDSAAALQAVHDELHLDNGKKARA